MESNSALNCLHWILGCILFGINKIEFGYEMDWFASGLAFQSIWFAQQVCMLKNWFGHSSYLFGYS
jgi:hypothetical protein